MIGILLINLGTPDSTGYFAIRRYLAEFLSDRRVIDIPRWKWWPILYGVILTVRPFRKKHSYDSIWNHKQNESPFKTITREQATQLQERLKSDEIVVEWAMCYGNPSIKSRIGELQKKGCDRLLVFPLYPQYSNSTTASSCDKLFDALKQFDNFPVIRIVPPYYENPAYIESLAISIEQQLSELKWVPEVILVSMHGTLKRYIAMGDPYCEHCVRTFELLRSCTQSLGIRLMLSFQSRFGSEAWLKPYTDELVVSLANSGIRRLAVLTPGFAADCLETLEEIGIELAESFIEAGGESFYAFKCLNSSKPGIDTLETLVRNELSGWVDS